ncbi:hypothetical protein EEZ25_29340 [Micromonospora aurantiaca]|uniref:hypothetical protein n=1 Tax=Micromonospora aurantiaca (nom. illeg.) TaxID=47850 RepID=UPI000F409856|nr:hypothetical protein [Micromonospora aurantiaca]RNH97788.1 hypothetical protein EEZ25_29340 [Micromonospora aurantiaca]
MKTLLVLLGVPVVALAGCAQADDRPASTPAPTSAAAVPRTAATATDSPASYRTVDDLCAVLEFRPLSEVFGPVRRRQHQTRAVGATTSLTCASTLGQLPHGVVVTVQATVGPPESGRVMYEGLRRVHDDTESLTDIADLGAGAYQYNDDAGSHVVVADANLYLVLTVAPLRLNAAPHAEPAEPMAKVAAAALTALRA